MKTENEMNKEYAEKLSALILSNPTLRVVVKIDTYGIYDDYVYMIGNLNRPEIEIIAVNYDNVYIIKSGEDYDDCINYYGYEAEDWNNEKIEEKAKQIPWEKVIAVRVNAL